jgi:hypothetical protein
MISAIVTTSVEEWSAVVGWRRFLFFANREAVEGFGHALFGFSVVDGGDYATLLLFVYGPLSG